MSNPTGEDVSLSLGVDPRLPARTLRMVRKALVRAVMGEQVMVVCGNLAEVDRIKATAEWAVKSSAYRLTGFGEKPIKFVAVTDEPWRHLRGTRGIRVLVDHFAATHRNYIEWYDAIRERS